jgi:[ribosomal protein S5]-alanine N-acetyltransferase
MSGEKWEAGKPVKFETKRFYIRSIAIDDVDEQYLSWWNDARVQESLNARARGWTIVNARRHVSKFNNKNTFHLGLFRKDPAELVGFVALFVNSQNDNAVINIVIGNKKYWGSGVPKEASTVIFPFVFEELKVNKLKSEVNSSNRSSLKATKDLGFIEEGILRQDVQHFSGERLDKHVFGLLAEDWRKTIATR